MLPLHIKGYRRLKNPQLALAKSALVRLLRANRSRRALIRVDEGNIFILESEKPVTKYDYSWMPAQLSIGDQFDLNAICTSPKQKAAAANKLAGMGLRHVGRGVWKYDTELIRTKYDYSWIPAQLSHGDQFDLNAICTSYLQRKAAANKLLCMGLRNVGRGVWKYESAQK